MQSFFSFLPLCCFVRHYFATFFFVKEKDKKQYFTCRLMWLENLLFWSLQFMIGYFFVTWTEPEPSSPSPPPLPSRQVQPSLTTQQHFLKTKQVTNLVRKLSNAFHQVLIGLPISSNHMSHYWYNIKGIFIIGTVSSKSNM